MDAELGDWVVTPRMGKPVEVNALWYNALCSYGLRSLSPNDPGYRPRYQGGVLDRDGAYHEGTVWAWLLGHYALAEYRVLGDEGAAQARLSPLQDHLADAGLGTVSEIFDGAPPHRPRGAPSQAWSVACVLEAWWRLERAKGVSPPTEGRS